jgi:hypothetical protein
LLLSFLLFGGFLAIDGFVFFSPSSLGASTSSAAAAAKAALRFLYMKSLMLPRNKIRTATTRAIR